MHSAYDVIINKW